MVRRRNLVSQPRTVYSTTAHPASFTSLIRSLNLRSKDRYIINQNLKFIKIILFTSTHFGSPLSLQPKALTTSPRTSCPTWTRSRCVTRSWSARSGTASCLTACCGRSSSNAWCSQTRSGRAWQNESHGRCFYWGFIASLRIQGVVSRRVGRHAMEEADRTHGAHRPALEGPGRTKVMVGMLCL